MNKVNNSGNTKKPTHKQAVILKAKQEHPNLTTREIAKIADTDHAYVIRTLRRYGIDRVHVDLYKQHRADILAGLQADSVKTYYKLTEKDKKKLIMRRGLVDLGISYDKERLERDLSTANIINVFADLEALRAAREGQANDQE
ncbi:MAG TPA: hypothetical protein VMW09_00205 [Desulfatiglandales bacterium]|nr:hypothetical protein [Desulfatiglandales bacterium]